MTSQVLLQALHMVPRNQVQSFNPVPVRSSFSCFARREFVVRAESNPEGEAEAEANENDVEESETNAAAEEEVEAGEEGEDEVEEKPKEPRKPRIKLGDIMGILNKRAIEASEKERPVPDLSTGDIVEIKLEVP